MYTNDIFAVRRCVHVKIRTAHIEAFRAELAKRRLSMQEVFDEFAALIAQNDSLAMKMIEKIIYNNNRQRIEKLLKPDVKPTDKQEYMLKSQNQMIAPVVPSEKNQEAFFDLLQKANPLNRDEEP